jgi:integrase
MNKLHESTLGKYKKILNLKNYSIRTIDIYCHYVGKFSDNFNKPLLHITCKEVKDYIENYNYSSIGQQNQIYSSLKLFCKYILNIKKIEVVFPERPRKEKHLPQVIDKEFLIERISKIKNLKHKAIISLGYSVGLRVSEVVNLRVEDIDSKRMIINIKQSKNKKDRVVPLTETVLNLLRDYYKKYKPKEYLFNGQKSIKYSTTSCNQIVKKYLGRDYHFHLLRHSCFTNLTEQGVDIHAIQKLAGHSSSKTTEIYTHVSTNVLNNLPLAL